MNIYQENILKIIDTSSVHGLPNIFRSKSKVNRWVWTIFFLISSGFCSYLVIETLKQYYAHDVNTQIKLVNEIPLAFPSVSICSSTLLLTNFSVEVYTKLSLLGMVPKLGNETDFNQIQILRQVVFSYAYANLTDAEKKRLSLPFDHTILSCLFEKQKCSEEDFEWTFDPLYGSCFKFNGINGESKFSTKSGFFSGLEIVLNMDSLFAEHELKPALLDFAITNQQRFVIIDTDEAILDQNKIIPIVTGNSYYLSVKKVLIEKLPSPYSNCQNDYERVARVLNINMSESKLNSLPYNQNYCLILNVQKAVTKNCQCHVGNLFSYGQNKICIEIQDMECLSISYQGIMQNESKTILNELCPYECRQEIYEVKINTRQQSDVYDYYMIKNDPQVQAKFNNNIELRPEMIKTDLAKIQVSFEDLKYVHIIDVPSMSGIDVFSSIGGTMGLFLGISLLSFIEIVEIFFEIVRLTIFNFSIKKSKIRQTR